MGTQTSPSWAPRRANPRFERPSKTCDSGVDLVEHPWAGHQVKTTQLLNRHRHSLRTGPAGTIFLPQASATFSNLISVFQLTYTMTDEDERELETELARLQQEHRDLDAAIDALHQSPAPDLLRLQRLKKRKLQLRDRIAFIEDQITPDIIA